MNSPLYLFRLGSLMTRLAADSPLTVSRLVQSTSHLVEVVVVVRRSGHVANVHAVVQAGLASVTPAERLDLFGLKRGVFVLNSVFQSLLANQLRGADSLQIRVGMRGSRVAAGSTACSL